MYRYDEEDKDINKIASMVKKAVGDENIYVKIDEDSHYDTINDKQMYDMLLKDVYKKKYITMQYIYNDDTIKMIKNKICLSIMNNKSFGEAPYIIPTRQYLWSEYSYDNKINKIMLGQKWIRRNELLNIDIEPNNNLRHYEELRGNLKPLRDNIKRYGNKIKHEDDEDDILQEYIDYITDNEIYMLDIYNELGNEYNSDAESLRNFTDVYMRIYFNKIKMEDIKSIIQYCTSSGSKQENDRIIAVYNTIQTDMVMYNEIMKVVNEVSKEKDTYGKYFKINHITQSVIHVNLRIKRGKINLYRLFNDFENTERYPFVQYQTQDGTIYFKFRENDITEYLKNTDNTDILSKWFENSPYGISFKVKLNEKGEDKFIALNMNENGRIEYKTQWKEEDMATVSDIKNTYTYITELINKINRETTKIEIIPPEDSEFRYAFINTIQKFTLPDKYTINHNDISDFARYFYPYVAVVVEPRKRQSKKGNIDDKSKFGSYLRYKRISKYDDIQRIEQRIMYFMRNYEYSDNSLTQEISKQFNITEERAQAEIVSVREKYPNIKLSRKVLKKMENIPKYKPPGIGIDIQGKQKENYKIRISGARTIEQLDRMSNFMNILLYLYIETYLYKKPERQELKNKLKQLVNIAKRRNKVDDIEIHEKEIKEIKKMTGIDKKRIGFKPEKGQDQWSRLCQNSGNDKKRRPQQYNSKNLDKLIKLGYILNKKTGVFERKLVTKVNGKKKEITLRTIKVKELDDSGNATDNDIHYSCDPEENGDQFYVGFLTKSNNPNGYCMPCCFKKDPANTKNKRKLEFYNKCLNNENTSKNNNEKKNNNENTGKSNIIGDKLYILQDTNKIQDGRFGYLPKHLDFYFNGMLNNVIKIKNLYLQSSETGYFFKFGTNQEKQQFVYAICNLLDIDIETLKSKIIDALEKDTTDLIFTSLNNGDIRTQFITRDRYIEFIKYNPYIDFELINSIMSIPGVISKYGLNIIIFYKNITVIKRNLDTDKIKEDIHLLCQNTEDIYAITDKKKQTIFLLKENRYYYPIVMVKKMDDINKNIELIKTFTWKDSESNIVNHIRDFYEHNCYGNSIEDVMHNKKYNSAREIHYILTQHSNTNKNIKPRYQTIDVRNKCKYIITADGTIVPTHPTGAIYDLQIIKSIEKYIDTYENTYMKTIKLYNDTDKKIFIKPKGVYYDKHKNDKYRIVAIMTHTNDSIPVIPEYIEGKTLTANNLIIENKPFYDNIDKDIIKGKSSTIMDERIKRIDKDNYYNESYELFRLEFSNFINKQENANYKKKLENIIADDSITKKTRIDKIKLFLFKLTDETAYELYKRNITNVQEGGGKHIFNIMNKMPELNNYKIANERQLCEVHTDKDKCNTNPHCHWAYSECSYSLTQEMLIEHVNKMTAELISNKLKSAEILQKDNYYVSDIVDINRFTSMPNHKIIRSSSSNIKKIMSDLFGKDNIPQIGKRRGRNMADIDYQQLNYDNPIKHNIDSSIQNVINNNLTIYRAYANAYYWLRYTYYENETRNLGYYSILQTDLANYFKSTVIDWLQNVHNIETNKNIIKYMNLKKSSRDNINEYINNMTNNTNIQNDCIVELYILNKINEQYPIVVYNEDNEVIYIFDNGLKYHYKNNDMDKKEIEIYKLNKNIKLIFVFITQNIVPDEIQVKYIV